MFAKLIFCDTSLKSIENREKIEIYHLLTTKYFLFIQIYYQGISDHP